MIYFIVMRSSTGAAILLVNEEDVEISYEQVEEDHGQISEGLQRRHHHPRLKCLLI